MTKGRPRPPAPQRARKGGERRYRSDQFMEFGKRQSIEELTGGRLKKKSS